MSGPHTAAHAPLAAHEHTTLRFAPGGQQTTRLPRPGPTHPPCSRRFTGFNDASLLSLLTHCPALTHLDATHCCVTGTLALLWGPGTARLPLQRLAAFRTTPPPPTTTAPAAAAADHPAAPPDAEPAAAATPGAREAPGGGGGAAVDAEGAPAELPPLRVEAVPDDECIPDWVALRVHTNLQTLLLDSQQVRRSPHGA